MKIAWATDIHLNFVGEDVAEDFCRRVSLSQAEVLLIGGDIAEATDLEQWLLFLSKRLSQPIYFVLGNHDYYGSDVGGVRAKMRELSTPELGWLPAADVVELTPRTALVGHGGWGDARLGDFETDTVLLSDYFTIRDLRECAGSDDPLLILSQLAPLKQKLHELGDDAASALRPSLQSAAADYDNVVVLTHVPPFREACWHKGRISEDNWLPGFTCKAMGDLLSDTASQHPDCTITVLCGHTHGEGEADVLENLHVSTLSARYGSPDFRLLDVQ